MRKKISDTDPDNILSHLTDEELLDYEQMLEEVKYDTCYERLYPFFVNFWSCHDPSQLHTSWVQECICEHIQAALNREIRRLTISIPPRQGKTVAEGTKVILADGGTKCIEDIKVGDKVLSFDINTGKHEIQTIENWWNEGKKEFYKVTLHSGKNVVCTMEHRLYTWDGYKHVKDLSIGDDISIGYKYVSYVEHNTEYSDAELRLLALWQAEGNKVPNSYIFTSFSSEIVEQARLDCTELGYTFRELKTKGRYSIVNKSIYTGKYIWEWLSDINEGKQCTTYTLSIPKCIFNLDLDSITTYLGMWIAADGWIDNTGLGIALASEECIDNLITLFQSIGFRCKKRARVSKDGFKSWGMYLNGKDNVLLAKELFRGKLFQDNTKLDSLYLPISDKARSVPYNSASDATCKDMYSVHRIIKEKRWTSTESIRTSKHIKYSDSVLDRIGKEEYWDKIKSIEYVGYLDGYDIEVSKNNNFVLDNGIHSHNSTISISSICWHWLHNPWEKFWLVSHGSKLFVQNILLTRRIMQHPMYKDRWMDPTKEELFKFALSKDVNTKTKVENREGGYILGGSPTSGALGMGYSVAFLDDVLDSEESNSIDAVQKVNNWYKQTFLNRSNDVNNDVQVIIMQRLHENDIINYVNETYGEQGWFNLVLPAKYESKRTFFSPIGFQDKRKFENELLDPVRLPDSFLNAQSKDPIIYNTRYQQNPGAGSGGNLVKTEWIRKITDLPKVFDQMITVWDLSFDDAPTSSYSVGLVVGSREGKYYILDMIRRRMAVDEQVNSIRILKHKYPKSQIGIEKRANGNAAVTMLKREIQNIYPFQPKLFGGSKEQRLSAILPELKEEKLFVYSPVRVDFSLDSTYSAEDIISEVCAFPLGANDDIVDALSYAIQWLAEFGQESTVIITRGNDLVLPEIGSDTRIDIKNGRYAKEEDIGIFDYQIFGDIESNDYIGSLF